jgi:hypothetical protein
MTAVRKRIDKWLWHPRVVRTRTTDAAVLVGDGPVRLNGGRISATRQRSHLSSKIPRLRSVSLDPRKYSSRPFQVSGAATGSNLTRLTDFSAQTAFGDRFVSSLLSIRTTRTSLRMARWSGAHGGLAFFADSTNYLRELRRAFIAFGQGRS